jgi:hypothetical protein
MQRVARYAHQRRDVLLRGLGSLVKAFSFGDEFRRDVDPGPTHRKCSPNKKKAPDKAGAFQTRL